MAYLEKTMRNPTISELQHLSRLEGNREYRRSCHEDALLKLFQECGAPRTAVIRNGIFWDQNGAVEVTRQATAEELAQIEELALTRDIASTETSKAQFDLRLACGVPLDARWDGKAKCWRDAITGEPLAEDAKVT